METDHRVCGMEDVEEPAADGGGQDVVLVAAGPRADPPQSQEHRQRRAHAEEVLHLRDKRWDDINVMKVCMYMCIYVCVCIYRIMFIYASI